MIYYKLRVAHEQSIEPGRADLYIYIEPSTKPQKPVSVQWRYVRRRVIDEVRKLPSKPTNKFLREPVVINMLAELKRIGVSQGYWYGC